mmetsp:Transcript_5648/g.17168  ORF Transcript_5648/g.17168 Transcript_5648/m.17168 type:complete len:209 (-) Transcript_5648:2835-3461(-)
MTSTATQNDRGCQLNRGRDNQKRPPSSLCPPPHTSLRLDRGRFKILHWPRQHKLASFQTYLQSQLVRFQQVQLIALGIHHELDYQINDGRLPQNLSKDGARELAGQHHLNTDIALGERMQKLQRHLFCVGAAGLEHHVHHALAFCGKLLDLQQGREDQCIRIWVPKLRGHADDDRITGCQINSTEVFCAHCNLSFNELSCQVASVSGL